MISQRFYRIQVVEFRKELNSSFFDIQGVMIILKKVKGRFQVFFLYTGVQISDSILFILVAFIFLLNLLRVNNTAGKSLLPHHHHVIIFVTVRKFHIPVGTHMAIVIFNVFPTIHKKTAFIVQTNKKIFGTPSQSVTNMDWWSMTQGKFSFTMRAGVLLL